MIERAKITNYLLNTEHRFGASKARFFAAAGFEVEAWQILAEALREHGRTHKVTRVSQTGFGPRYTVEGRLNTPDGRCPVIHTVWQMDEGTVAPRLISAYPMEAK